MKKQVKIATGAAAVLLIGLIGFCAWFLSGVGSAEYYSQIDNSKIEQVDSKGGFDFWFEDCPSLGGHSLHVAGTLTGGPDFAGMEG